MSVSSTAGARPALTVGPPPEFGGDGAWWSPEHLLLASLNTCLMATFGAMARAQGLHVDHYRSKARAVLSKSASGLAFTELVLEVQVAAAGDDVLRVAQTLRKAKERCIVAGALLVPVQLEMVVEPVRGLMPV